MLNESNLHKYQRYGINKMVNKDAFMFILDMGMGKTIISLTAISYLLSTMELGRVLVTGPKRVVTESWQNEFDDWSHISHISYTIIQGDPKKRRKLLKEQTDVHFIGIDNITWLCGQYGGNMLPYDAIIIDESSLFKDYSSKRFSALKKAIFSVKRRYLLTGTPAPNKIEELWPQLYLLDGGKRLGRNITAFRDTYAKSINNKAFVDHQYSDAACNTIYEKISDISMSMMAADYLDVPECVETIKKVNFTDELIELYKDFKNSKVLEFIEGMELSAFEKYKDRVEESYSSLDDDFSEPLEDLTFEEFSAKDAENGYQEAKKEITAAHAAALLNKLLQFANGSIYDDDRNVIHVHDLKINALKEDLSIILEHENVIIAYSFIHDKTRLLEAFKKYKPRTINEPGVIKDWNDGKVKILLMHPKSGGHGLNLQKGGSRIVWFGNTWSLELLLQTNKRVHRQGQKKVSHIDKYVMHPSDESRIIDRQSQKKLSQDALIDSVKAMIDEYEDNYF